MSTLDEQCNPDLPMYGLQDDEITECYKSVRNEVSKTLKAQNRRLWFWIFWDVLSIAYGTYAVLTDWSPEPDLVMYLCIFFSGALSTLGFLMLRDLVRNYGTLQDLSKATELIEQGQALLDGHPPRDEPTDT